MAITPTTNLYLLQCPIEIDNANQLTFNNAQAQYNYFSGLNKDGREDFTYQRKDSVIRYPDNVDNLLKYNYVMYQNENYSNKWFYAFITDMRYVNDNMTEISITTDVYQTWMFDISIKDSFVEREHVSDDTVGTHTLPEGLDLGEFEIVDQRYSTLSDRWYWCFMVTELTGTDSTEIPLSELNIGGVFSSMITFAVNSLTNARNVIKIYNQKGKTDAIVNIYPIPVTCVNTQTGGLQIADGDVGPVYCYAVDDQYISEEFSIQQPDKLYGNYTPKNNKLFTYPYSYFYASNGVGTDVVYHWEDFTNEGGTGTTGLTAKYAKAIVPSSGISAKLYFLNYKGIINDSSATFPEIAYNNGINFAKTPVCAWTTDYYTNWLTQNGVNVAGAILGGLAATVAGEFTLNPTMVAGGLGAVFGAVSEMRKADITPNQAQGDVNTGDVMFGLTRNIIKFYMMSVRPENAKIIDDYFSMFGYKVNALKKPNITGRPNWNYVKCIDVNITGNIPQTDLQSIKGIFNTGVTFWHNPATFLDYTRNNK